MIDADQAALQVQVWRPATHYVPLNQALPVRTGDELQVRFRVPAKLHVALSSINGQGHLSLLQQYPPQDTATELVYPAPSQTRALAPPAGTEILLVCGRAESAMTETELQAALGRLRTVARAAPPDRLLRLQPGQVREEGEHPRDFGATRTRAESDAVTQRLNGLRERLRPMCVFFEGLAFDHE